MTSVCQNQDTFNQSFRQAVKYVREQDKPKNSLLIVAAIILAIIIIWSLLLANKVGSGQGRTEHFLLALLFSPAYIISYYLNNYGK